MDTLLKKKQMAYDLTMEAIRSNNILHNIDKNTTSRKIEVITEIYENILEELKKSDIDL